MPDDASSRFVAATIASGRLTAPAAPVPRSFKIPLVLTDGSKRFGKEYPGFAAVLALGSRVELEWLVNPILSGLLVSLTFVLGRSLAGAWAGVGGALIVASSTALAEVGVTYLNTVLSTVLLVATALTLLPSEEGPSFRRGALAGFLWGWALATKPFTAVLLIPPLAFAMFVGARRRLAPRLAAGFIATASLWIVGMIAWNVSLTGDAWRTPYQIAAVDNHPALFAEGKDHYTPDVALRVTQGMVLRFCDTLFPVPWLGRVAVAFGVLACFQSAGRRRWPLALALAMLVVGHYFFAGNESPGSAIGGARHYFEAMPAIAVLIAAPLAECARTRRRWRIPIALSAASIVLVTASLSLPRAFATARAAHADPLATSNRRLERFVRELATPPPLLLFVDVSTYNLSSAMLVNRPDLSGPVVVAIYYEPEQNRKVMDAFPGRATHLVRWSRAKQVFEMTSYVPEKDNLGPPNAFPYNRAAQRRFNPADGTRARISASG